MKIRADHREKTDDCKTEMLVTWLRQTTNASWSTVVRALVGIRMGALAQKVAVKYGESVTHKNMFKVQFPPEVKIWIKEDISIVKRNFVLHKVYCMCVYSAYMSSCFIFNILWLANRLTSSDPRPWSPSWFHHE